MSSKPMSEEEIVKAKLRARGFSEEAIKEIIAFYKDLVNFAPCWIRMRIKEASK